MANWITGPTGTNIDGGQAAAVADLIDRRANDVADAALLQAMLLGPVLS